MVRDGWLRRKRAMHQAVLLYAHVASVKIASPIGRPSQCVGLPALTVGDSPALLPSNRLACGKRARLPGVLREPRADWAAWQSVWWLMKNRAWRQMIPMLPGSDTSLVVSLCSLLLAVLFPVVIQCDTLDASAKAGRSCTDQSDALAPCGDQNKEGLHD